MNEYIKGESIELNITIKNENLAVIDLDTFLTITLSVYNYTSGTILKQGTKAGGEIVYNTTADTGVIKFCIEDGLTAAAEKGVYAYLLTVTQNDTCFDDSTDTGKYTGDAFRLK